MDWDEVRTPSAITLKLGEPLDAVSIAELDARVLALEAEIARVKAEIERKRRQADAANAFFK